MTWNDDDSAPAPSPVYPAAYSGYADPTGLHRTDIGWSPDQMNRLEGEWRRLQRAFAYHPFVTINPLRGDPPAEYQVDFRVTTLVVDEAGQLQYATGASFHVWLPAGFPGQPPVVRPMAGLFHPNVSWEGVYLASLWHPNETLVGLVRRLGDVLAYRHWEPEMTVNPAAMDWVGENHATLPLDRQADFSPAAGGGEPLARVCHHGAAGIAAMRQSLVELQASLFAADAPDAAAVRDFSLRTRLAVNLFLENDVPDDLRSAAGEVDECAREVAEDVPRYDYLRGRRAATGVIRSAARAAADARGPLAAHLDKLAAVVDAGEPSEPTVALKLIPEMSVLSPFQLPLPKLIGDADRKAADVRAQLAGLAVAREPHAVPSDTLLGRRLGQEFAAVARDLADARREARDRLADVEPLVARAKADALSLERIVRWREYVDMVSRARALERRVAEWGAEGVQAYFIENESGRFGPFQFEQPVDLGGGDLVVRNVMRGAIEVRRAAAERVLAGGRDGAATVDLPAAGADGADGPRAYPTTFRLTERCDDLLVQFDFLRRQTAENILTPEDGKQYTSRAWVGYFAGLLALQSSRDALKKELSKVSRRWRLTMMDLAGLAPYKERLATYFLVARAAEAVPDMVRTLRDYRAGLKETEKRLADIAQRSGRDVDTDRLIVPPKLTAAYNKEMAYRKEAGEAIERTTALLKSIAQQLAARLRDKKSVGQAGTPSMRLLAAVPDGLASLPLDDDQLGGQVIALEELLRTPLGGPRPGAAPPPPAAIPEPNAAEEHESAATVDAGTADAVADVAAGAGAAVPASPESMAEGFFEPDLSTATDIQADAAADGTVAVDDGGGEFAIHAWDDEAGEPGGDETGETGETGESDDVVGFRYEPESPPGENPKR